MVLLSAVLRGARSTPGKQWIGKHRRAVARTATVRRTAENRRREIAEVERQLSRPFLSVCEEQRHSSVRRREYAPRFVREAKRRWVRREGGVFQEIQRSL